MANGIDILQVARTSQALGGSTITELVFAGSVGSDGDERSGLNNLGQVAYQAILADGKEVIARFTIPDIHWTNPASGFWSTNSNWTQNMEPTSFHDTFIDPASGVTVRGDSQNTFVKSLTIGATASGQAVLQLNNGGDLVALDAITINQRGRIDVGTGRVLAAPSLTNRGVLAGNGQVDAVLTNQASGEVRAAAGERLRLTGAGTNSNNGKIEALGAASSPAEIEVNGLLINSTSTGLVAGQHAVLRFGGGLTNNGSLVVSSGANSVSGDIINSATGKIVVTGGAAATFYDDVTQSGMLQVDEVGSTNSMAVFAGSFTGGGGAAGRGDIFFLGDLRPGNSTAAVTFGNDVSFGDGASLEIELGGTALGSQYDHVTVAGDLSLGGTLDVSLVGGFTPAAGNTFDILDWTTLSGTFDAVQLPTLTDDLQWNISQLYTSGVLSIFSAALAGDYNADGSVDAADYVVWRKTDGSESGYELWRTNFGRTAATSAIGSSSDEAAGPEPVDAVLLMIGLAGGWAWLARQCTMWDAGRRSVIRHAALHHRRTVDVYSTSGFTTALP